MFERMLVGKMENRITVGVVSFVATMVLLGWAAINEGGRMASLEETYHARAIEIGADLFTANCTRCHGPDGRGQNGFAPGLNNPQFFGHDLYPEITAQVTDLQTEIVALTTEKGQAATTDARKTEIDARLAEIEQQIGELEAPRNAALSAAVDIGYDPQRPDRLKNVSWGGTRDAFILTTLIHGRPVSNSYWKNGGMPTWGQTGGGPLRTDQLEDLVAYIENWDKGDAWTAEDLFAVKQFALEPVDPIYKTNSNLPAGVGSDVTAALTAISGLTANPDRGSQLYHGQIRSQLQQRLPCSGCHQQSATSTGPMTDGTFTRVQNTRLQDPPLAGYTPEQYLVESILLPGNYIVPGFQNVMQAGLGDLMSAQDLADIVAYLETMTQPQ
jgi:mono/diheme cytochrome c family protein